MYGIRYLVAPIERAVVGSASVADFDAPSATLQHLCAAVAAKLRRPARKLAVGGSPRQAD